jgi:hypothetical protein
MGKIKVLKLENSGNRATLAPVDREQAKENLRRALGAAARLRFFAETREEAGFRNSRKLRIRPIDGTHNR